ncbi:ABC transporter permease [Evansella tamaricis]|uniref:ABC transporter permease n=1 Tax=Evansella tamaricis TaxID=2069301 RepID=A0ABS6JGK7_9BACI|nr:ABC transporter permease [Evansella tamaricis]MBU9712359.1 ABC transporter permease [Evansella tamaricis]
MVLNLLIKDLLQLYRDRKELVILLLMPLILISILGFSLRGMIEGGDISLNIDVAVVDEGEKEAEKAKFEQLLKEKSVGEGMIQILLSQTEELSIPEKLVEGVFQEGASDIVTVYHESSLEAALQNEENVYAAVIHFPENYRVKTWENLFLDGNKPEQVKLYLNEEESFRGNIISAITESFYRELSLSAAIGKRVSSEGGNSLFSEGNYETLSTTKPFADLAPITSFEYYTIGMAVMFVLYVATYSASYAYTEKETHVFDRMLLTEMKTWNYGIGKWLSSSLIAFVQLCVLFGLSSIFYSVHWQNIHAFLLVTITLSISVGALGVFITSLNYKFETRRITDIFSSGIISILAFLGGSFVSVTSFSETLWRIGAWTPNGAALQSYLLILRGGNWESIMPMLGNILILSIFLILLSLWIFPKRREL